MITLLNSECRDHAWVNHAFLVIDSDGMIRHANRRCEELLGYCSGELIGKEVDILVPVELRAAHPELRRSFFEQATPRYMNRARSVTALCCDGRQIQVIISLSKFFKEQQAFVMAQLSECQERGALP